MDPHSRSVTTKTAKQTIAAHESNLAEAEAVWATIAELDSTVTGNVTKMECQVRVCAHRLCCPKSLQLTTLCHVPTRARQLLNRIFLNAGQNEAVVPASCLKPAGGKPEDNYHGSKLWPGLARRSTRNAHAVQHAEGTEFASLKSMKAEHVTGGPITLKECSTLAQHLSSSVRSLALLPDSCGAMASKAIKEAK